MRVIAAAALLLLSALAVAQQADDKGAYPPPGKLVDIGGYALHLNCSGKSGPTVVLISGGGGFSVDWALVQPNVAGFARVCSYDFAGIAWSDPGPTPRTMRQDAFELHSLLKAARVQRPYVLVGHSLGGLTARVYAENYPSDVGGMVLIDPTHEDGILGYQGKLVRVRERASATPVPLPQTIRTSPPKPPTAEDLAQFESFKSYGPAKIFPPFDKLPASAQTMRLWFLAQPPRAAGSADFLPEEMQGLHVARAKAPNQLGNKALVVILPRAQAGKPPPGISAEEWNRINEEKRKQKIELTNLSTNSKLIIAEKSGHHIQLDEPQVVTDAVRLVVEAVRRRARLTP